MNSQRHGDYQATTNNGVLNQNRFAGSHMANIQGEIVEESYEPLPSEETRQAPWMLQAGRESIAYKLLLLQQRLAAYEQLHNEEMAELRTEIERLRRVFLQETNSQRLADLP